MLYPSAYIGAQLLGSAQLFVTLWTVVHQAPQPMKFSRHEYWSGLPFPTPGDLPHPGIEFESPVSPALAGRVYHCATWKAQLVKKTNAQTFFFFGAFMS